MTAETVRTWRGRYADEGMAGLAPARDNPDGQVDDRLAGLDVTLGLQPLGAR
jgi:hypothetical protein